MLCILSETGVLVPTQVWPADGGGAYLMGLVLGKSDVELGGYGGSSLDPWGNA